MFQYKGKITQATPDSINQGIIHNRVEDPTENNMYIDDNLVVDTWERLRITLACSIETLFDILGYPEKYLYKSPLSLDKYFDSKYSYIRKKLGYSIDTRNLIISILYKKYIAILKELCTT